MRPRLSKMAPKRPQEGPKDEFWTRSNFLIDFWLTFNSFSVELCFYFGGFLVKLFIGVLIGFGYLFAWLLVWLAYLLAAGVPCPRPGGGEGPLGNWVRRLISRSRLGVVRITSIVLLVFLVLLPPFPSSNPLLVWFSPDSPRPPRCPLGERFLNRVGSIFCLLAPCWPFFDVLNSMQALLGPT